MSIKTHMSNLGLRALRRATAAAAALPVKPVRIVIGKVAITRCTDGSLWLHHVGGEGIHMRPMNEAKLAAVLEVYFVENF